MELVNLAIHKQMGVLVAIKFYQKMHMSPADVDKMIQNVEMLHNLNHPNILQFIDFYQDERFFYLVTD